MVDLSSLSSLVQRITGALVWVVANVVYLDKRRRGRRGLARFFAFWLGMPVTVFTLFLIREGDEPLPRPPDDDDALLQEIRRDRTLRDGSDEAG